MSVGIAGKIAKAFIKSKLTPLIVLASLLLGIFAVIVTPREEEPQIVVPMIDVMVAYPGASAKEVERACHQADGEVPLGDKRRRICLFNSEAGDEPDDSQILRGRRYGDEPL